MQCVCDCDTYVTSKLSLSELYNLHSGEDQHGHGTEECHEGDNTRGPRPGQSL